MRLLILSGFAVLALFQLAECGSLLINEVDYVDLVRPCLNDLVANLIHHQDADGQILYEARESFELTPRRFKAVLAKARKALMDTTTTSALLDQRKMKDTTTEPVAYWPFLNRLGNFLFGGNFAIDSQKIHQSPALARKAR